jgi:uncharacterized membrane protein
MLRYFNFLGEQKLKYIVWLLLELITLFISLGLYPLYCFFKFKMNNYFKKKYSNLDNLIFFTDEEMDYQISHILHTERINTFLIITIPSFAIFLRCTYIDYVENYYGFFTVSIFLTIIIIIFIFQYYTIYKLLQSYKSNEPY